MPYRTGSVVRTKKGTFSPKALLAATIPALGTLIAVVAQWAATGEFDRAETVTAVTGVATSALAFIGAWSGYPGEVEGLPSDVGTTTKRPG